MTIKSKIFSKSSGSSYERDITSRNVKSFKVELSSFVYNDFNPDSDEYEEQEVRVKKSEVKYKIKDNKGKLKIILESANIEFKIDDEDQKERFLDKDWAGESITPTLKITSKEKKGEEYIDYQDSSLFELELVY